MSHPRIIWNGNYLDFPQPLSGFDRRRKAARETAFSASGRAASVFEHAFDEAEIALDAFSDRTFFRALQAWWSWAARGKPYSFALDADDAVSLTLSGAANAGQAIVPLVSTSGIVAGRFYRLRSADSSKEEIIEAASVEENVSVTAAANLLGSYAAGDVLRSEDYFPGVVSLDEMFPAEEKPFLIFEMKHKFREVA